jgi:predicted component of type VI protein secretion system
MALSEGWDKNLYKKISEENPAGEYLRFNSIFEKVKGDRAELIKLLTEKGYSEVLYDRVEALFVELVGLTENQSKDFLIALWIVELLIVKDHFSGMRRGIEFLQKFLLEFWEFSHPQEEDWDQKVSMLQWFDNAAAKALTFTKVITNIDISEKYYNKADLELLKKQTSKWSAKKCQIS